MKFSGKRTLDALIFEDIDLVSISEDEKGVDVHYTFDYNADSNEYRLSVIANTEDGEIIDNWLGTPYLTSDGAIDIAFATDNGVIYLSDLEQSGVLENCGWFSKLLKAVAVAAAVVAAVAVVVAVVVVSAPAVAAAATTVATAVSVGGGTAAFASTATAAVAAAAAAGSAAMATTAFAVATTTALIATTAAVTSYVASMVFETLEEKVKVVAEELSKVKEYSGTMIFRADLTGNPNKTLTPRPIDTTGLSFFDDVGYMFGALVITYGVYITSVDYVATTGVLYARKDSGHHYSVVPTTGDMKGWIASYSTAKTVPHFYTETLKGVCYFVPGI